MMKPAWRFYVAVALACLMAGCSQRGAQELILFTTIGPRPFQDYVYSIRADGSRLRPFLSPERNRSYVFASGNSLHGDFVVTVHERDAAGKVVDKLYLYRPDSNQWRHLNTGAGMVGAGVISPDNSRAVFVFSPDRRRETLRLWVADLKTGATRKLTSEDQEEAWDGYPAWRPDGQEIMFIRLRLIPGGVATNLMRVSSNGGEPTSLLGGDEGVTGVCYSPDGQRLALLSNRGLEVMETSDLRRTVILPWSSLPKREYYVGGLAWSPTQGKIAFALFNTELKESELWTVRVDGKDAEKIHCLSEAEGKITVASFVQG